MNNESWKLLGLHVGEAYLSLGLICGFLRMFYGIWAVDGATDERVESLVGRHKISRFAARSILDQEDGAEVFRVLVSAMADIPFWPRYFLRFL